MSRELLLLLHFSSQKIKRKEIDEKNCEYGIVLWIARLTESKLLLHLCGRRCKKRRNGKNANNLIVDKVINIRIVLCNIFFTTYFQKIASKTYSFSFKRRQKRIREKISSVTWNNIDNRILLRTEIYQTNKKVEEKKIQNKICTFWKTFAILFNVRGKSAYYLRDIIDFRYCTSIAAAASYRMCHKLKKIHIFLPSEQHFFCSDFEMCRKDANR